MDGERDSGVVSEQSNNPATAIVQNGNWGTVDHADLVNVPRPETSPTSGHSRSRPVPGAETPPTGSENPRQIHSSRAQSLDHLGGDIKASDETSSSNTELTEEDKDVSDPCSAPAIHHSVQQTPTTRYSADQPSPRTDPKADPNIPAALPVLPTTTVLRTADVAVSPCQLSPPDAPGAHRPPLVGDGNEDGRSVASTTKRIIHVNFCTAWRPTSEDKVKVWEVAKTTVALASTTTLDWDHTIEGSYSIESIERAAELVKEEATGDTKNTYGVLSMDDSNRCVVNKDFEQQSNTLKPVYDALKKACEEKVSIVCRDARSMEDITRLRSIGIQDRFECQISSDHLDGPTGWLLSWWEECSRRQQVALTKFLHLDKRRQLTTLRSPGMTRGGGGNMEKESNIAAAKGRKVDSSISFELLYSADNTSQAETLKESFDDLSAEVILHPMAGMPISISDIQPAPELQGRSPRSLQNSVAVGILLEWEDVSSERLERQMGDALTDFDVVVLCLMGYLDSDKARLQSIDEKCPLVYAWWSEPPETFGKDLHREILEYIPCGTLASHPAGAEPEDEEDAGRARAFFAYARNIGQWLFWCKPPQDN